MSEKKPVQEKNLVKILRDKGYSIKKYYDGTILIHSIQNYLIRPQNSIPKYQIADPDVRFASVATDTDFLKNVAGAGQMVLEIPKGYNRVSIGDRAYPRPQDISTGSQIPIYQLDEYLWKSGLEPTKIEALKKLIDVATTAKISEQSALDQPDETSLEISPTQINTEIALIENDENTPSPVKNYIVGSLKELLQKGLNSKVMDPFNVALRWILFPSGNRVHLDFTKERVAHAADLFARFGYHDISDFVRNLDKNYLLEFWMKNIAIPTIKNGYNNYESNRFETNYFKLSDVFVNSDGEVLITDLNNLSKGRYPTGEMAFRMVFSYLKSLSDDCPIEDEIPQEWINNRGANFKKLIKQIYESYDSQKYNTEMLNNVYAKVLLGTMIDSICDLSNDATNLKLAQSQHPEVSQKILASMVHSSAATLMAFARRAITRNSSKTISKD